MYDGHTPGPEHCDETSLLEIDSFSDIFQPLAIAESPIRPLILATSFHAAQPGSERNTWSIVGRKLSYLLRAIGLGSILTLFDPNPMDEEQKKVIVETSVWVALARCSVHILPIGISVFLLSYNFIGSYVGAQLSGPTNLSDEVKFQLLQFAAKIHELLIVASTGHVVFYMVRYQLLWGNGMPLGLIGSGFSFTDLSFFWYLLALALIY